MRLCWPTLNRNCKSTMAELITIARPYAEAAFGLAKGSGQLAAWSSQLDVLAQLVSAPEVADLIGNPAIDTQQLQALLVGSLGKTALPDVARLVAVLLENHRTQALPEISTLFQALKHEAEGVLEAQITSAFPLTEAQIADLVKGLEKRFARKISATVAVDAALIGGVRITVGDDVIDDSVQGKLQAMAYRLKS